MRLCTAEQMRAIDQQTIEEVGIPGLVLMENAGRGASEQVKRRFASLRPGPVLILCGKGNNGGDGYIVARYLLQAGWRVRTVVLCPEGLVSGDAAVNLSVLRRCGGEVLFTPDASSLSHALCDFGAALVVDALLGTGVVSQVRDLYASAIAWINACGLPVAAIDIPSGVEATSGRILGCAVRAQLTITFGAAKVGLAVHPGAEYAGELLVVDIGIPPQIEARIASSYLLVEAPDAAALLPPRPSTGHKGTFGHVLVVAGSVGKSGAAVMTGEGALRSGTGLVTVAAPGAIEPVLAGKFTEAMTHSLSERDFLAADCLDDLVSLWQGKSALALGPGMGQRPETFALIREVIRTCPLPLVLDADGLNAIAADPDILASRAGKGTVLTPHPGEMARLVAGSVASVEEDRIGAARALASRYAVTVVLKGARTVVALPDGRIRINGSGNPGLASGGMGDVLTGVIAGLLGQGLPAEDAAVLGVFLHGFAADRLAASLGMAGMLATDLLRELPPARRELVNLTHALEA